MTTPTPSGPEWGNRAFRILIAALIVLVVGGGLTAIVISVPDHRKSTATSSPGATASSSTDPGPSASASTLTEPSSSAASSSTDADPSAMLQQQITTDYKTFLSVNDQVFNSTTVDVNVFNSVATGDELTHLIELATQMRGRGYVSTGETRVVSSSVVVASARTTATVTACLDTSGVATIDAKTGQRVGHGSGHQLEVVYMVPVASTWKVSGGPPQPTAGTC